MKKPTIRRNKKTKKPTINIESSKKDVIRAIRTTTQSDDIMGLISEELRQDEEVALAYLASRMFHVGFPHYIVNTLKRNKQFCIKAIFVQPYFYAYILQSLKEDDNFIFSILSFNGMLLKEVAPRFQDNYKLVKVAATQNGNAIRYASKRLRNKLKLGFIAVAQTFRALQFLSISLRSNTTLILLALKQDETVFQWAANSLKNNLEFFESLLQDKKTLSLCFEYAGPVITSNKIISRAVLSYKGNLLRVTSKEIRSDREASLIALTNDGSALQYVDQELLSDREMFLTAIRHLPHSYLIPPLCFASDYLRADPEIILAVWISLSKLSPYRLTNPMDYVAPKLTLELKNYTKEHKCDPAQALRQLIHKSPRQQRYLAGAMHSFLLSANTKGMSWGLPSALSYNVSTFFTLMVEEGGVFVTVNKKTWVTARLTRDFLWEERHRRFVAGATHGMLWSAKSKEGQSFEIPKKISHYVSSFFITMQTGVALARTNKMSSAVAKHTAKNPSA